MGSLLNVILLMSLDLILVCSVCCVGVCVCVGVCYCINECQFSTFEGLSTAFEGSSNVTYNTSLHTFVPVSANA